MSKDNFEYGTKEKSFNHYNPASFYKGTTDTKGGDSTKSTVKPVDPTKITDTVTKTVNTVTKTADLTKPVESKASKKQLDGISGKNVKEVYAGIDKPDKLNTLVIKKPETVKNDSNSFYDQFFNNTKPTVDTNKPTETTSNQINVKSQYVGNISQSKSTGSITPTNVKPVKNDDGSVQFNFNSIGTTWHYDYHDTDLASQQQIREYVHTKALKVDGNVYNSGNPVEPYKSNGLFKYDKDNNSNSNANNMYA